MSIQQFSNNNCDIPINQFNNCNTVVSPLECASQVTDSINHRIYDRNIPSSMLQPYIDARPVSTKYSLMPIVDPRKKYCVPLKVEPTYSPYKVFNPGNTQSPWSGFASNINVESELRNQIYALQKCSQAVYVPSSNSDLYKFQFQPCKASQIQQPYQALFKKEHFSPFNPNPENIGQGIFMNHTRQQTKNYTNSKNTC
jgi:hypothetical protein